MTSYSVNAMTLDEALWRDKDRMSGAVCFRDTRVPVSFLFEHIEAGKLDQFYAGYPNVSEEQVLAVLEASKYLIEAEVRERASA